MKPRLTTRAPGHPVALYDGHCAFCRAAKERLLRWSGASVEARDFQVPGVLDDFPGVDHAMAMRAMLVVWSDGRVFENAEAVARVLLTRPLFALFVWIYFVPGIRFVVDVLYRRLAAMRYRIFRATSDGGGCDGGTCAIHFGEHDRAKTVTS